MAGTFNFSLSNPISSTNLTISYAAVNGYTSSNCSGPYTESDTLSLSNSATIVAGEYFTSKIGSSNLTSTSIKYKQVDSLTVNGTSSLVNGSTFVVGGTTVTVSIPRVNCCNFQPRLLYIKH